MEKEIKYIPVVTGIKSLKKSEEIDNFKNKGWSTGLPDFGMGENKTIEDRKAPEKPNPVTKCRIVSSGGNGILRRVYEFIKRSKKVL